MNLEDKVWLRLLLACLLFPHVLLFNHRRKKELNDEARQENGRPENTLDAIIEVDEHFCFHISINASTSDELVTGYKVYYTLAPDETSFSSGWENLELSTSNASFTVFKDGRLMNLKPNAKYIARVAQLLNGTDKTVNKVTEFATGPEVSNVPTNLEISVNRNDDFRVVFDAVVDSCNPDSKYIEEYTVEYTTGDPELPATEWTSYHFTFENITDETKRIEAFVTGIRISLESTYAFIVYTYDRNRGFGSKIEKFGMDAGALSPQVKIRGGPTYTFSPSPHESFTVVCEAISRPAASIRWHLSETAPNNGYTVDTKQVNDRTVVSTITVPARVRNEKMECTAENMYGVRHAETEIRILGPGSPPQNITGVNNHRGLRVNWEPPLLPNGDITNYIVYLTTNKELELANWQTFLTPNGAKSSALIATDRQHTYYVRVQTVSSSGPGIISGTVAVPFEVEVVPLEVSLEVLQYQGTANDDGSLEVDPGTDIVFSCAVYGSPAPSLFYHWSNGTDSEEDVITINPRTTGLYKVQSDNITTRTYTSQLLVCGAKNTLESNSAKQSFVVNKPGAAPQNVRSSNTQVSEATLEWDPPVIADCETLKYKIYVSKDLRAPDNDWTVFQASAPKLELYRKDITPSTDYYAKVSAVNDYGEGIRSESVKFRTGSGAPRGPPQNVNIARTEANELKISWTPPQDTNGEVQQYTLYFTKNPEYSDDQYKKWRSIQVRTNDSECEYILTENDVGRQVKEIYRLRLTVTNDLAESAPTVIMDFETLGRKLPVPTNLEASVHKDNTVLLKFDPVRDPADDDLTGYIEAYTVSVTTDSDGIFGEYKQVASTAQFDLKNNKIIVKIQATELTANTSYWARVRAEVPSADGSKPVRFQTGPGVQRR